MVLEPWLVVSDSTRVFEIARSAAGTTSVIWYGILKEGSSQQGKALRASSASNCVKTYPLPATVTRYRPTAWVLNDALKSTSRVYAPGASGWSASAVTRPRGPTVWRRVVSPVGPLSLRVERTGPSAWNASVAVARFTWRST